MKNFLIILLFVLVAIVSALFFAQNDAMVEIKYFSGSMTLQMNWVLVTAFLAGVILGVGLLTTSLLAAKLKLSSAQRKLTNLEKEVANLRALPIKNDY